MTGPFNESAADYAWRNFEASWRAGVPPDIWSTIASSGVVIGREDLAVEFAMMDLEWRWRKDFTDQPRTFIHYCEMLSSLSLSSEHLVQLLEHEFIVRSRWGDKPSIEDMLEAIDNDYRPSVAPVLERALDVNFPVYFRLLSEGKKLLEGRTSVTTEFGKQRIGEPDVFDSLKSDHRSRYIIADSSDTFLEDTVCEVSRISFDKIRVKALSSTACFLNGRELNRSEVRIASIPTTLDFAGFVLSFDRKF